MVRSETLNATTNEDILITNASFLESAKDNLFVKTKEKLNFQFKKSSIGYIVFALFILGFVVGRTGFFENVNIKRRSSNRADSMCLWLPNEGNKGERTAR